MLLFWICAALLTVVAVLAVTRPLVAQAPHDDDARSRSAEVEVYRDQLAEIETDKARGLINEAEAEAARLEVARRLLASAGPADDKSAVPTSAASARGLAGQQVFMVVAAAVPLV